MCGSSATAASARLEVRGQQPSTAELRGNEEGICSPPRLYSNPESRFLSATKKAALSGCLLNRSFVHRYCAAGFLRCVAGAFLAGAFLGAAFVSSAPLFMVITKGLGS